MGQIDKEFEEYLCWLNVLDINSVINILKKMPDDLDDDINKSIVDVIKSSKKEFIKDSKKINMPPKMLNECIKKCNDFINIKNKELTKKYFKKKNYNKKIMEQLQELKIESYNYKMTENQLQELVKRILLDKEKDNLKNMYLNNNVIIADERINKWKNYFEEWKNASIEDFNNEAMQLGLNKDGTYNKENNNTEKIAIFRIVIYFRTNKLNNNTELIKKIIEYEFKKIDVEKNTKIDKYELKKWQDFYYKWYYNKNKLKCLIKRINITFKEKILKNKNINNKIEIELFRSAMEDRKV